MSPRKITVVCMGNIARSPTAAKLIERKLKKNGLESQFEIISRGVQGSSQEYKDMPRFTNLSQYPIYKGLKPWFDEHDIDLSNHASTPISEDVAEESTLILAMDKKIQLILLKLYPEMRDKIYLFTELIDKEIDILDPQTILGLKEQLDVFNKIENVINLGFERLLFLVNKEKETARKSKETV